MRRQLLLAMILAFAPAVALAGPAVPSFPLDSTPPLFDTPVQPDLPAGPGAVPPVPLGFDAPVGPPPRSFDTLPPTAGLVPELDGPPFDEPPRWGPPSPLPSETRMPPDFAPPPWDRPPFFGTGAIVTPEPGTALLLGGGILALAFSARRRPA